MPAVAAVTNLGIKSLGIGTNITTTWTGIAPTSGRGLAIKLIWGDSSSTITVSGLSLATDGALSAAGAELDSGLDTRGRWFYIPSNAGTQDLTATYTSSANSGAMNAEMYQITGHNTSTMIGATVTSTGVNTMDIVGLGTGSLVLLGLQGGNSEPGTPSGGGGTWSTNDDGNAQRRAWSAYSTDILSGTQTLNWTEGDWAYAIEVLAAGGGGGTPDVKVPNQGIGKTYRPRPFAPGNSRKSIFPAWPRLVFA